MIAVAAAYLLLALAAAAPAAQPTKTTARITCPAVCKSLPAQAQQVRGGGGTVRPTGARASLMTARGGRPVGAVENSNREGQTAWHYMWHATIPPAGMPQQGPGRGDEGSSPQGCVHLAPWCTK